MSWSVVSRSNPTESTCPRLSKARCNCWLWRRVSSYNRALSMATAACAAVAEEGHRALIRARIARCIQHEDGPAALQRRAREWLPVERDRVVFPGGDEGRVHPVERRWQQHAAGGIEQQNAR